MYGPDGARNVANFMGNGAHGDSGAREQLMQPGHFMRPEFFGAVEHHCRKARSGVRAVGGETDIGQEGLSIVAMSASLHDTAKVLLRIFMPGNVRQRREVTMNRLSRKRPL